MRVMNLKAKQSRGHYNSYNGKFNKKCTNYLLDIVTNNETLQTTCIRNFETTGFNQKWTTGVSEFHIAAGKLYLSPIMDMHNGEIISFNISRSPNFAQTMDMLNKVFVKFDDLTGLIFHSDQGWQYQMERYQTTLKEKGIIQSMSRKGNCLDNSLMENFFGIMKNEMFYGHEYEFKDLYELEKAMVEYIDYYNNERIKAKLKGLSPVEYRQQYLNNVLSN